MKPLTCPEIDGDADTFVGSAAVLLPGVESGSFPVTVALFVNVPVVVGVTEIFMPALEPLATPPRLHVNVGLENEQLPWLGAALLNVMLAGKLSVTVTPVAADGPLLLTVSI